MCTALNFYTKDSYFGRTLDLDCSYGEEVCILPRRYPVKFRNAEESREHSAIIGMATVMEGVPLFYDAVNEHGVCMAGLNFPKNAYYAPIKDGKDNIAPFEFIPWVLCRCRCMADVKAILERLVITDICFSDTVPNSPLHWMICRGRESVVVESMRDGLHVYENPVGVLTNNPPFDYQLFNLNNYRNLRVDSGENTFAPNVTSAPYCQGLGALGLPGDLSSMSRFVRAVFGREHSACESDEGQSVNQFFHILSTVEMTRGLCVTDTGKYDITVYTSCMNTDKGIYYYTTYDNRAIRCVDMHSTELDAQALIRFKI